MLLQQRHHSGSIVHGNCCVMITNMPYHAYKYDMMRLYDDCTMGLKRAMYRHQVTRDFYKPDLKL